MCREQPKKPTPTTVASQLGEGIFFSRVYNISVESDSSKEKDNAPKTLANDCAIAKSRFFFLLFFTKMIFCFSRHV